jgi:hypothetical protein
MAIGKKPNRNPMPTPTDEAVQAFILGADHTPGTVQPPPIAPVQSKEKVAKVLKEPVILRFDPPMLAKLDQRAERSGLSRSAFVRMVVAKALEEGD